MSRDTQERYLDAVRAFAALLVVTVHTQQWFPPQSRLVVILASMGQLGVQLFFVLSAFLIFQSLDRLRRQDGGLVEFAIHRFLRIAPLYYVAIVVMLAIKGVVAPVVGWTAGAPASFTPVNILANILFLHGLLPDANNTIVSGGWSVGTEFLFYALAPVMFLWRDRPKRIAMIGVACFPLIYIATATLQPSLQQPEAVIDNGFLYFSILNQLPVFVCGALLFCWREQLFALSGPLAASMWVASMAAVYFIWTRYFGDRMTFAFIPALAGVSSVFLIVTASKVKGFGRIVLAFGRRAFSIYIMNLPALLIVWHFAPGLPFFVALPLVALIVYLAAGVTYQAIERPGIRLGRRLSAKITSRSTVAAVDPRVGTS